MFFNQHLLAILLVLATFVGGAQASFAANDVRCYLDWSDAGPVVRGKKLVPVARVLKSVSRHHAGRVIKVKLCERSGGYVYRVAVSASGGGVLWLRVDARTGRIQPLVRP